MSRRNSFPLVLLMLSLLLSGMQQLSAQKAQNTEPEFEVEAVVSTATPLVQQNFSITYSIKVPGRTNKKLTRGNVEFGDKFRVLGERQNTTMEMNGRSVVQVFGYTFTLQPLEAGTHTLPGLTFYADGEPLQTNSISVKVLPADASQAQQQADNIFVEAYLSNPNPYEGEEVFLSYKLFSKYHLNGVQVTTPQVFDGFAADHLNKNERTGIELETHNGQRFQTASLNKYQLYPLKAGEHLLEPLAVDLNARIPTGRRDPFWGSVTQNKTMQVKSPKLRVRVKALPTVGRPADFSGAVGSFKLVTSLSDTTVKAGEPLTLKIKVSGDGNMKLISEPKLTLPPGFEAYDPKIKHAGNTKSYEYLLIPSHAGSFEIDPYRFSYFDPKEERYVTRSAPLFKVAVERGENIPLAGGQGGVGLKKEEVAMLGQDIRFIMTAMPRTFSAPRKLMGSGLFYGGLTLPFALALMLVFVGRNRKLKAADVSGNRTRKATKVAQKRLKGAESLMQQGDRKAFYDENLRSIWGYLSDKFGIEQGQLSREKIREVLSSRSVSESSLDGLVSLLDRCEMALFAPAGESAAAEMRQDFDAAIDLISKIESEIA